MTLWAVGGWLLWAGVILQALLFCTATKGRLKGPILNDYKETSGKAAGLKGGDHEQKNNRKDLKDRGLP